jgi:hypothetical protein
MTKVCCSLVVDVASLSLLARCCGFFAPESPARRQLCSRLLAAFLSAHVEQIHHCMLFSLQHLQFVLQWYIHRASQLQLKIDFHMLQLFVTGTPSAVIHFVRTIQANADSQRHQKTSPQKYVTRLSVQWNHIVSSNKPCRLWRMLCPKNIPAIPNKSFVEFRMNPMFVRWGTWYHVPSEHNRGCTEMSYFRCTYSELCSVWDIPTHSPHYIAWGHVEHPKNSDSDTRPNTNITKVMSSEAWYWY